MLKMSILVFHKKESSLFYISIMMSVSLYESVFFMPHTPIIFFNPKFLKILIFSIFFSAKFYRYFDSKFNKK